MTVGIVEWARRARGAWSWELTAADALGRHVASSDDIRARLELVARARRHAWRAEQWESVVPVLHDVAVDATEDVDSGVTRALAVLAKAHDADDAVVADAALMAAAAAAWRSWCVDAAPVADLPYLRAAERCLDDAAAQAR